MNYVSLVISNILLCLYHLDVWEQYEWTWRKKCLKFYLRSVPKSKKIGKPLGLLILVGFVVYDTIHRKGNSSTKSFRFATKHRKGKDLCLDCGFMIYLQSLTPKRRHFVYTCKSVTHTVWWLRREIKCVFLLHY